MTLGENLQRLRRERGLSQEDVAQKLFVSRQSVSKWELDQAEPGVEYLKALAELYGVTLDELLGRTPAPPEELPAPAEESGGDSEAERDHIELYRWFFAFRTLVAVIANLMISIPAHRVDFPLDWIATLVGLFIRKRWVWWVMLFSLGASILMNLLTLDGAGLIGLAVNGAFLCAACSKGIRAYFNISNQNKEVI